MESGKSPASSGKGMQKPAHHPATLREAAVAYIKRNERHKTT
ncbi:hypothetical protein [Caballeronia eucalypticola]